MLIFAHKQNKIFSDKLMKPASKSKRLITWRISARLLKQILLKSNIIVDYMERDSARGAIQPGLKILAQFDQTGLGFSARAELRPGLKKSHVIEKKFQPGLKSRK